MSTAFPLPRARAPRGRGEYRWLASEQSDERPRRGRRGPGAEDGGRGRGRHQGRRPEGRWSGGPRGRQAARGDVRAAVLALLAEEPMHGYQMIRELAERTDGAWRPSPGSVYPTLAQLEDEGLVEADHATGRRVFALTAAGREHVAGLPAGAPPWEAMTGGDRYQLRDQVRRLAAAVAQVDEAGTPAQRTRAGELLEGARRAVYRLLAEDDDPAAQ